MDSTILQLFTSEEILGRLARRESTGAIHVFTSKESANLFFRDGLIVAAAKGLVEGEEVVRQVLEWKNPRFVWQPDYVPPPALKRVDIDLPAFLAKLKAAPKLEIGGKVLSEAPVVESDAGEVDESTAAPNEGEEPADFAAAAERQSVIEDHGDSVFTPIPAHIPASEEVAMEESEEAAPLPPRAVVKSAPPVPSSMTATKNINPTPQVRTSYEESLLRKHQLALEPIEEEGGQPLRIRRLSNLVGRNPACDFTLDHVSISRQHCLLQVTERGLHAKDLATTNGTKVNGIALTEGYLNLGDKLTIGHLTFVLRKDEEPAAVF
jgi:hypothetical protein